MNRGTWRSLCDVCAQSVRLRDPMGCSPPGSSAHGILQEGILEWVPFLPPGNHHNLGTKPASPALAGRFFTTKPSGKLKELIQGLVWTTKCGQGKRTHCHSFYKWTCQNFKEDWDVQNRGALHENAAQHGKEEWLPLLSFPCPQKAGHVQTKGTHHRSAPSYTTSFPERCL